MNSTIEKRSLKAGINEWYPWITLKKDEVGTIYDLQGPMAKLLQYFASKLDFKFIFSVPPDDMWGERLPDGSYTGMIGMVHRNEVELAVGPFVIDYPRHRATDFTNQIFTDSIAILVGRQSEYKPLFPFLHAFHLTVWLVLLMLLLLSIISYISMGFISTRRPSLSRIAKEAFMSFLAPLTNTHNTEPESESQGTLSQSILLTFWKFASRIMCLALSAVLLMFLIVSKPEDFMKCFEDFVKFPNSVPQLIKGDSTNNLLEYSIAPAAKLIWERCQSIPKECMLTADLYTNSEEFFMKILTQKEYFFVADYTATKAELNKRYKSNLSCGFHLTPLPEYGSRMALAVSKYMSKKTKENINILSLHYVENGLINHYIQKSCEEYFLCIQQLESGEVKQIKLMDLVGIFIIYLCGICIVFIFTLSQYILQHRV